MTTDEEIRLAERILAALEDIKASLKTIAERTGGTK